MSRLGLKSGLLGLLLSVLVFPVLAAGYPEKPVRMVVPWAPGGGSDVTGRIIGAKMAEAMGQQVLIDNRAGAAGNIGTASAARNDPDGYTLLLADTGFSTGISLYNNVGYHPLKDFLPISLVALTPIVAVVHPSVPATNMKDLITLLKNRPGKLTGGSGGTGGSVHLSLELFQLQTGTKIIHVPYKGSGPASIDLGSGQIDLMFSTAPAIMPMLKVNRIRGLAVATPERFSLLPDLPTMQEAGVPNFVAANWYGILAPTGTPRPVVDRLHADLVKITALPDIKQRLSASGLEPKSSATPQAFGTFLRDDVTRWERVIREANIKL
ncbi:MAG: tripartite tricarboxylate transporter substrate binding protein [Burkholderiales bacterium]|nr:tripartite tricarboxylate transporter substrate binding protein [Burkholderiales bacterium]